MSIPESLTHITGKWAGSNRLWLDPGEPADVSETTASAALAAQGQFLTLRYTWSVDGEPREGLLVMGCAWDSDQATAAWINSWHMAHQMMFCRGGMQPDGTLSVQGTYPAPSGPDWGWRIALDAREPGRLIMRMFNIAPDLLDIPAGRSREELAVEASYTRRPSNQDTNP